MRNNLLLVLKIKHPMKNVFFLFLVSFLFIGFSNVAQAQSKESMKRQKFVNKFTGAVSVKKRNRIIKCIEKSYVSKHLDGTHKGNKNEFLANFFAGIILQSNELSKVPLSKIFDIRLTELNELQAGIAECKFILSTPEGNVETTLYLKSLKKKGKFAFVPKRT